jgi:hypothetical protein
MKPDITGRQGPDPKESGMPQILLTRKPTEDIPALGQDNIEQCQEQPCDDIAALDEQGNEHKDQDDART